MGLLDCCVTKLNACSNIQPEGDQEEVVFRVEKDIRNRKETHYGIYADIGTALDAFSTKDLIDYYMNRLKCEGSLRYYLEQQIIAFEINRLK